MKTVQINKVKVKIFEENELKEKLNMSNKDIELVTTYQKTFPELLQDESGFCINGETLCNQLGVKDDFTSWLLADRKTVKGKLIKYRCVENTDFTINRETSEKPKGGRPKTDIKLTLECAKKIAMRQNNEQGDLVCGYFILMEKALRDYEKWISVREPERKNANKLKSELKKWSLKNFANCDENGIYAREFNMINQALTNKTALEIKTYLGYKDKQTREHLTTEVNKVIDFLQEFDINLLTCNMNFEMRNQMIRQICETNYSHIKECFK
jgi:phage anti-repressor protein